LLPSLQAERSRRDAGATKMPALLVDRWIWEAFEANPN
jgi:hypothetical protein